jgi:F-type H+-transporting ATPase subunit gamma
MASTREIRRRIRGVKNISQVTRAMEMVSAAKMRKAQQRVLASRPYAERLRSVIGDLASLRIDAAELQSFPLLTQREIKKTAVILVTPDKGLTGPMNSNLIRRASRYVLSEAGVPVEIIAAGRKGRDFMVRTRQEVVAEFTGLGDNVTLDDVRTIVDVAIQDFIAGKVDAVFLVYSQFVNTLVQRPEVLQVLPIQRPEGAGTYTDYIFEPDPATVLTALLPRFVEIQVYQALLESIASEHSARMVAMRNATDAANDLVSSYSLAMNKARQAQITGEVAEISAGANAMRGR